MTVVGAGPGAPDLLTLRGAAALAAADAVVYDELGDCEAMIDAHCAAGVRRVYVGKRGGRGQAGAPAQASIEATLAQLVADGLDVVRLKGGDPAVFGRLGSELAALRAAGVGEVHVVPGVSALSAAPLAAGFPLTAAAADIASFTGAAPPPSSPSPPPPAVAVATAHDAACDAEWASRGAVAASTLVLFMGARRLGAVAAALREGEWAEATPLAVVQWAHTTRQRVFVSTVGRCAAGELDVHQPLSPAIIVVGDAVAMADDAAAARAAAAAAAAAADLGEAT